MEMIQGECPDLNRRYVTYTYLCMQPLIERFQTFNGPFMVKLGQSR